MDSKVMYKPVLSYLNGINKVVITMIIDIIKETMTPFLRTYKNKLFFSDCVDNIAPYRIRLWYSPNPPNGIIKLIIFHAYKTTPKSLLSINCNAIHDDKKDNILDKTVAPNT